MRRTTPLLRFVRDTSGVSAIEFAILLPVLVALMFGGFSIAKGVAISRKVTITTRALADLTSQYPTMAQSDMDAVKNASTQIIAPFDSTPLNMRISEIQVDATGNATVVFSTVRGMTFTPYKAGTKFTGLPANMPVGCYLILAETSYIYASPVAQNVVGPIALGDRIFMLPRQSTSVTYSGT